MVVKGRLSLNVSGMASPYPDPFTFTNIEFGAARMHKVELALWVLLM